VSKDDLESRPEFLETPAAFLDRCANEGILPKDDRPDSKPMHCSKL